MKRTVSEILREASADQAFADKAIHRLQAALRGEKLAALARRVVENERGAISEKSSSVAQRLMDLRKNREPGRRWVLSVAHPGRLQGLLDACGLSPEQLARELEHDGWHPAWPELGRGDEMWLDSVPGLPGGVGELIERARALRPGQSLLIAGPQGIGLGRLARTVEDELGHDVERQGESNAPLVQEVDSPETARLLLDRLKNEKRPGVVFLRAATKAEALVAQHPPDVLLEPWTGEEIAALAARLGSTLPGRQLSDVASELWIQLGSTFAWTPREVGFVLRAVADHGADLVSLRALGPSLVEAVARSRTPDVEPALLRDSFLAICRAAYEGSLGGRWPGTLGRRQIEGVVEQVGLGLPPALTSRIARHSALAAVADLRDQLGAGKRSKRDAARALETLERCLESPPAGVLLDCLVRAELLIETPGGYQPAFRLAALTTAAVVEWSELADRAYEPELHAVAIAAARGADDAGSVLRAVLDAGPGRAVLGLRVALALVAHGMKVHAEQARAVVGSVVAVLTSGVSCPWLDAGSDVTADLRVASERFGDELAGELPVLDAIAAWLQLAPTDLVRLTPSDQPNLTASWLPFQHRSELLAESWTSALGDFELRILRRALKAGDARAREIASGIAMDERARELGRRLGVAERLAVLEVAPPDDAYDHLNAIEHVLEAGAAEASVRRKAYRSFLREADVTRLRLEDVPLAVKTKREWIEALGDARELRLLELLWERAHRMVRDALKEDSVLPGSANHLAPRLELGKDPEHIKLLATTLADAGDLGPLRTLAKLGTGPRNWNPDVEPSGEDDVRESLSPFACLELIARRDTEGLRALLAEAIRDSHARIAVEEACEAQLDTALYAASDLVLHDARYIVFRHLEDPRCRALTREWASTSQRAVAELLYRPSDSDADVIEPWLAADKEAWALIPDALRHPSPAVQRLAIEWLLERTGAEVDQEVPETGWLTAPESSFVIDRVAMALDEHGARKKSREALRRLALLIALGVAGIDREHALRKLMPSLARHDASLARSVIADVTERRGDVAGTACARAWASGAPDAAPLSILKRAGHDWQAATRGAAAMSAGELEAFVGGLPADAWGDGERPKVTGLDAHPHQALRELARRDSERFVRVACASFERFVAEGHRSSALVVTEWIANVDGAAAAALMDGVLASPSPRGSQNKKKGRPR